MKIIKNLFFRDTKNNHWRNQASALQTLQSHRRDQLVLWDPAVVCVHLHICSCGCQPVLCCGRSYQAWVRGSRLIIHHQAAVLDIVCCWPVGSHYLDLVLHNLPCEFPSHATARIFTVLGGWWNEELSDILRWAHNFINVY